MSGESSFPASINYRILTFRLGCHRIADWLLNLALHHQVIIFMPDYRLIPESTGLDILSDLHDFFAWLAEPSNLTSILPANVVPDVENVLISGESAGGWLALQSGFHVPKRVKAVISQYPMIDLRNRWYTEDFEKQIFRPPLPQLDRSILVDHVANLRGDEVITSPSPPARQELFMSMLQQGSFGKFFGDDGALYPIEVLDKLETGKIPPTWILHGKDDSVIPIEGSYKYVEALRKAHPDAEIHVSYQPGDHGFDGDPSVNLESDWVKEGLSFIGKYWP